MALRWQKEMKEGDDRVVQQLCDERMVSSSWKQKKKKLDEDDWKAADLFLQLDRERGSLE